MRVLVQEGEPFYRQGNSQVARDLILVLPGSRLMLRCSVVGAKWAVLEAFCREVPAELEVFFDLPILVIPSASVAGWCNSWLLRRGNAAGLEEDPCFFQGLLFLFFSVLL